MVSSAVEARLGSTYAINNQLTSHCQSTLIASKCDCWDRAMLLLAFLDSPGIFFMLATVGIVDRTFRCLPTAVLCPSCFHVLCMDRTAVFFLLDRTERKCHHIFRQLLYQPKLKIPNPDHQENLGFLLVLHNTFPSWRCRVFLGDTNVVVSPTSGHSMVREFCVQQKRLSEGRIILLTLILRIEDKVQALVCTSYSANKTGAKCVSKI